MWQKEYVVSISMRNGWFWIEFPNLARVNLTHTLGTSNDCSEATICLSFRLVEQGHHKWLYDRTHTNCAGHTSVALLHDRTPVRYAERTPACRCMRKTKLWVVGGMSTPRADWLLGLPLYHILRYVASTFKRIATTTTLRPYQLLSTQMG
jgi:hypothetical protein